MRVNNAIALIEQIGARPERRFGLTYDLEKGIQLTDSKGDSHVVKFWSRWYQLMSPSGIQIDASLSKDIQH